MKVGVTGATGFIGQYLIRDYGCKYDFIVPVREESDILTSKSNVRCVRSNYSTDSLCKVFEGCDAVIHLASKGMPKECRELRMDEYVPNITLTSAVMESCKELGINRLIYTSSKSVYDKSEGVHSEREQIKPFDEYGISKACSEMIVDYYARIHGMSVVTLRMPEVCGIDLTRGMVNPFWNVLLLKSIHKETIPIYGSGSAARELIYVKDVIRAIDIALSGCAYGIFNISSGQLTRNLDIVRAFNITFSDIGNYEFYPEKEEWGTKDVLDVGRALNELGFKPYYGLSEMVEDIKKEYESNQL